jgi:negative regulator of sigma E activity
MKAKRIEGSEAAPSPDEIELRLSCLLDGEIDEASCRSVLDRVRGDDDASRRWELLNCVGDAMRSAEVAAWHRPGFVGRVSAALEREPTVLAPAALPRRTGARRWLLPGAGVAAAAAIVLAVGLSAGPLSSPSGGLANAPAGIQAPTIAAAGPIEVARSPVLERYLAAHRELADPSLMPFSTPYVRTSGAMIAQETR